jgi:hypothetical protein
VISILQHLVHDITSFVGVVDESLHGIYLSTRFTKLVDGFQYGTNLQRCCTRIVELIQKVLKFFEL